MLRHGSLPSRVYLLCMGLPRLPSHGGKNSESWWYQTSQSPRPTLPFVHRPFSPSGGTLSSISFPLPSPQYTVAMTPFATSPPVWVEDDGVLPAYGQVSPNQQRLED